MKTRKMMRVLLFLGIHNWEYKFSTKHDTNYRECRWTGRQQVSGYRNFVDIDYRIEC